MVATFVFGMPFRVRASGAAGPGADERGRVPRAAHHRHVLRPGLRRRADLLAHVGLALLLARVVVRERLAQRLHRLGDRLERAQALARGLDDVLPPALGVPVAGDLGQRAQRVLAHLPAPAIARLHERVRGGQVAEAHGDVVLVRVDDRAPLGREARERPERGAARLVRHVREQRDGRRHLLVRGQRQQLVGVGRAFDQDRVRLAAG